MRGIVADANNRLQVDYLVSLMRRPEWIDFWINLELGLVYFEDIGLSVDAPDAEVWAKCQVEQLILITDNRNHDDSDSLEAIIRRDNSPKSLPIFTISSADAFRRDREYADRVVVSIYEYLLRIESILGAGRIYLP